MLKAMDGGDSPESTADNFFDHQALLAISASGHNKNGLLDHINSSFAAQAFNDDRVPHSRLETLGKILPMFRPKIKSTLTQSVLLTTPLTSLVLFISSGPISGLDRTLLTPTTFFVLTVKKLGNCRRT